MVWRDACAADAVTPGCSQIVDVDGREIGLIRVGKELFAVLNYCTHDGGAIALGRIEPAISAELPGELATIDDGNPELQCPRHHWAFDLRTGACTAPLRRPRLKTYSVKEENGRILVDT